MIDVNKLITKDSEQAQREIEAQSQVEQNAVKELVGELLNNKSARIFIGLLLEESGYLKNAFVNSNLSAQTPGPNMDMCTFNLGKSIMGEFIYSLIFNFDKREPNPHKCMYEYAMWIEKMQHDMKLLSGTMLKEIMETDGTGV